MLEKKAKIVIIFFIFFFLPGLYPHREIFLEEKIDVEPREDELVILERMIRLTEEQQKAQVQLKSLIVDLRKNKEIFMKGEASKLHALYIIEGATKSLKLIRQYHLEHLFSSDFMEDLAVLSTIGKL